MERKFVSIWFPYLLTDWICIKRPQYKDRPMVVTTPKHGKLIITHLNSIALANGIFKNMALADARAIRPGVVAMNEREGITSQLLKKIAEWCIRFSPLVSTDDPEGILMEVTGCPHLWGGDQHYANEISRRLSAHGYRTKLCLAPTPGAAWACARFFQNQNVISRSDLLPVILSLPPESLRIEIETTERLHKLGLRKLRDFLSMPKLVLLNRFGKLLNHRIAQLLGKEDEILQPVLRAENIQERLPCPELILTRQGIDIALDRCMTALIERLKREGLGIRKAIFRIYKYDGLKQECEISTFKPSCNKIHLLKLFEDRIVSLIPEPGIELFILEAKQSERTDASQESMWELKPGLNNPSFSELLDKISNRLGPASISRYLPAEHHWPERSFQATQDLSAIAQSPWTQGKQFPVELLSHPVCIEVAAPVPDYPPMLFRYKQKVHRIKKADGPERIEREWWLEEGEHRDYYALEDEEGIRFWVYRSGHYSGNNSWQWFLCGFMA